MLAYLFVLVAIAFRVGFIAHPMNFTPLGASLLFFGAKMPRKQAWIPVALFAGVDLIQNYRQGYAFSGDLLVSWAFYAAIVGMGMLIASKTSPARVAGASLASSVGFFLVSNFAVWVGGALAMYPRTLAGLLECYAAAVPFFRNSVIGDLVFAGAFFGASALVAAREGKALKHAA
jgi:hypothetical protein